MNFIQKIALYGVSLAVCFSCVTSFISVHAEDETGITPSQTNGGTSITLETVVIPSPNYTVSVPAGIPIGDITRTEESSIRRQSFTVNVSNFANLDGKQVEVTLSTPYAGFYLFSGNHVLPYEVFSTATAGEGTAIEMNGLFYTFLEPGEVTGRVEVDQFDIPAEGEYGGILNFHFRVSDRPTS